MRQNRLARRTLLLLLGFAAALQAASVVSTTAVAHAPFTVVLGIAQEVEFED